MVVHLEVSGKIAKDLVKAIENINEECVWSFDSEGLHTMMADGYTDKLGGRKGGGGGGGWGGMG